MSKNEKQEHEIVVRGQKIPAVIEEVDIFKLHYWKENPRVNSIINQKYRDKSVSDQEIEDELWKKDSVKDLYDDIQRHGGLIDEVLVKNDIVLEGNSRLCAYRHLYRQAEKKNNEIEKIKWSCIRSRIIPSDTQDEIVFSILGTWHIKGKKEWDTFEKAAYLKRMNEDYNVSIKDIATSISQSEKFIKDNIEAHDLMVKNGVYTLEKFSYFYELVREKNKPANSTIFNEEAKIVTRVIETIKDESLKRAEDIRNLPKILKDDKARKAYLDKQDDFHDALDISVSRHPEHGDSFYNQIKKTTRMLRECNIERIAEINGDAQKKYIFKELFKEVNKLAKKFGVKE